MFFDAYWGFRPFLSAGSCRFALHRFAGLRSHSLSSRVFQAVGEVTRVMQCELLDMIFTNRLLAAE